MGKRKLTFSRWQTFVGVAALMVVLLSVATDATHASPDSSAGQTRISSVLDTPTDTSTPTPTCTPATYSIAIATASATIEAGTQDIGLHADDANVNITFPFPVYFYGVAHANTNVSSNGNLQFNSDNRDWSNVCLPSPAFFDAIYPYWDDLRTDMGTGCSSYTSGCGVFTSTSGSPGSRVFNIEWRAIYWDNNAQIANFELRLHENEDNFDVVYGQLDQGGSSATVGVQRETGSLSTQYECNSGSLVAGLDLLFTYDAGTCPTYTPLPTNTATSTVTQTPSFTRTSTLTPTSTPICPGSWTSQPSYPITVLDNAVASANGIIYSFSGVSTGALVTNSYKYNPATNTWITISSLPSAREQASAVFDGTYIYILGGADDTGSNTTTVYRYDPIANTYATMAPFTVATWAQAAAFVVEGGAGKIYKIAGCGGGCGSFLDNVEKYDIPTDSWTTVASYPLTIGWLVCIGLGNQVYCGGGINTAETNKTYSYDVPSNTWVDGDIADMPSVRWGSASDVVNGRWILAGGYMSGAVSSTTIQWNPTSNTWSYIDPMLQARARMSGATINNSLYVVGGRDPSGGAFTGSSDNQRYQNQCEFTQTPAPTPTPTGVSCSVQVLGATTSCVPPSTYNDTFTFGTTCVRGTASPGDYTVYFEVSSGSGGPWTAIDQQQSSRYAFPIGTYTDTHVFTENNIPFGYTWYRMRLHGHYYTHGTYEGIDGQTVATGICAPSVTPIPTCGPTSDYVITQSTGSIVPGTTDTGNHTDDGTTNITLPFTYNLYGQAFTNANLDSNGNLQFTSTNTAYSNNCLPDSTFTSAIFPYWDDLRTDTGTGCSSYASGCGIFTSLSGTAPNRVFNIEWRTVEFANNANLANFELNLYEGQSRFDVVYGTLSSGGNSATVGVQNGTGPQNTQFECNTGGLSPGMALTFQQPSCGTPTPTSTPTVPPVLVGHLTWQGITQPNTHNAGLTGTLTLCSTGTPYTYTASTDASGYFTTTTGLQDGVYSWRLKGPKWLSTSGTLTLSGNTSQEFGSQAAGDANNDNIVSSVDFNITRVTFGKTIGDPGYDPRADFNNDDTCNVADFNLLKGNFGIRGALSICSGGP